MHTEGSDGGGVDSVAGEDHAFGRVGLRGDMDTRNECPTGFRIRQHSTLVEFEFEI